MKIASVFILPLMLLVMTGCLCPKNAKTVTYTISWDVNVGVYQYSWDGEWVGSSGEGLLEIARRVKALPKGSTLYIDNTPKFGDGSWPITPMMERLDELGGISVTEYAETHGITVKYAWSSSDWGG